MITSVPVYDWGVTAGYGLFETLRIYDGKPFLVEAHVRRLLDSCQTLSFQRPGTHDDLIELIERYIKKIKLESGAVRISVTYGNEARGIAPHIFFTHREIAYLPSDYEAGIDTAVSPYRKNEYSPVVSHKTFNQLENILALKHCRENINDNVKECIFLNSPGYLAEGSKSNIFFVREGNVFTPSVECGILPGITRQKVIELLNQQGIDVLEAKFQRSELESSDECFCTNSLMEVMPVVKIDNKTVGKGCPGPVTRLALSLYRQCVNAYIK